ncbi:TBC1 domain family member 1 isoform X2 [Anabrus simplex]
MYLVRDSTNQLLYCYLFQATDPKHVVELFNAMREQSKEDGPSPAATPGRSMSSAAALTSLSADISPSNSHFFEVLYIGKIKVSHKKVPDSFIDDALEKFRIHELEKGKGKVPKCNSSDPPHSNVVITLGKEEENGRRGSQDSTCSNEMSLTENVVSPTVLSPSTLVPTNKQNVLGGMNKLGGSVETLHMAGSQGAPVNGQSKQVNGNSRSHSPLGEPTWTKQNSVLVLEPMRNRAASTGSAQELRKTETTSGHTDHNRIMLFQVGRTDLHLISPDRKQILLHKQLRDVASCIQGIKHADHFGFICREANVDNYIGYVFKCQSESVADDVVGAITQAFLATSEAQRREKIPVFSCELCPMVWYHKLCSEVDGLNDKRTMVTILRRLELLPEEEQTTILTKFRGAETSNIREQNEFLMMLLRAHCESKQSRHVHDTAENRHEFLNQYLGGSTIFMKAKRSLTSSFDQLLKRKGSRDDFGPIMKELSLPMNASLCKDSTSGTQSPATRLSPAPSPVTEQVDADTSNGTIRPRSSTVGSLPGETLKQELQSKQGSNGNISTGNSQSQLIGPVPSLSCPSSQQQKSSPMMNIFFKVGNSPKASLPHEPSQDVTRQSGSWRQAIFNRVVTPNKSLPDGVSTTNSPKSEPHKRDRNELRALWKKAINQQLLLIRMEKENARLRARQEEATVKRIKLEYDEIGSCVREVMEVWDLLVSKESRITARCDSQMLLQAIRQGVPRSKRGDVWQFLAEQYCLKTGPPDTSKFPNYNVPYESLLKQLASHPHNILVDLGRTFPGHTYFSSPLGPGQLALFNLLKAYSLLDPEVGYCQGLNFVAGVLLLHMTEESAFILLRHLMFRRGLRRQYLPDMVALQVQLYQLSRLLHDQYPDLYAHFDAHEIAPTLYAAPWILTVFASQFPLGFVTRVFDLMFLESPDVIFRVALALLGEHKEGLLACESFEEIMDYLKNHIPNIDKNMLDRVMKQVFILDISKQLHEYEVEYHVLQEEMAAPRPDSEALHKLEMANRNLACENQVLTEQLEIATSNIQRLETTRSQQQLTINRLESQVRSLEVSVAALGNYISTLVESKSDIEIPGDIRRLITQLSVAEQRRKSSASNKQLLTKSVKSDSTVVKGVPVRVIETGDSHNQNKCGSIDDRVSTEARQREDKHRATPYPLKSALSSPNLSSRLTGMSSFFSNSHSHMKQQQQHQQRLSASNGSNSDISDIKNLSSDSNNSALSDEFHKNGSSLSSVNISSTRSENSLNECLEKANSISLALSQSKLKTSQSSYELTTNKVNSTESEDSGNVTPTSPMNHIHPLDTCLGVNFSYGGTTKLKTIRPLRAHLTRNSSNDNLSIKPIVSPIDPTNPTIHSEPQALSAIAQSKTSLLTR